MRLELDLDHATSSTPGEVETGVDDQSMKPGVESIRVAQARKVAPGADERVLDRVARELGVPEDQPGGGVQPRDGQVDERGEGVMIASPGPLDETSLVHVFASAMAPLVFAVWYAVERTLSIHSIVTTRREAFYWLAILFTFALGTAAGDLVAEKFDIGYALSILIFGAVIGAIAFAHYVLKVNAVLTFWLAYIMTRPLGASIGDEMSQSGHKYGGLGLGTTGTSYIFLGCILALVAYLSITKRDQTPPERVMSESAPA